MRKFRKAGNAILNKPGFHSVAAMSHEVNVGNASISAGIDLSDCTRSINLDFNVYSNDPTKDFENNLFKINTLIRELEDFRKNLIKGQKILKENKKEKESNKKK